MTTTTHKVTGMTCQHCVASVTEEVSAIDNVKQVQIDLPTGMVTVESEGDLDPAALLAAIDEAGYQLAEA